MNHDKKHAYEKKMFKPLYHNDIVEYYAIIRICFLRLWNDTVISEYNALKKKARHYSFEVNKLLNKLED
jgi:hypothetical protein